EPVGSERAPSQDLAEVSLPHQNRRNRDGNIVCDRRLAELFPIEKEKRPIVAVVNVGNPNRTTHRKTVIVPPGAGPQKMAVAGISKRHTCVEVFIHEIVVAAAVKLVGTGLHREIKETGSCLSEFRSIIAGLNRELLDGFDAGLVLRGRGTAI